MSMKTIHGDIIEADHEKNAIHFAIDGDPDNTIWVPKSVIKEGLDEAIDDEDLADVDLLVETWWFILYSERFDDGR